MTSSEQKRTKMIVRVVVLLAVLVNLCAPSLAISQTPSTSTSSAPDNGGASAEKGSTIDLTTPNSPAFSILGLNPQNVTRPATPKAFATSLLNGVDKNGNIQSGLAIDTVPFMLVYGDNYTIDEYRDYKKSTELYLKSYLANTSLSIASTKGSSSADKSTKVAGGLRFVVFDLGDPRLDLIFDQCLADAFPPPSHGMGPPTGKTETAGDTSKWDACKKASRARNWNRSAWDLGAAISANSPNGQTNDFSGSTKAFYTTFGYGFENALHPEETIAAVQKSIAKPNEPQSIATTLAKNSNLIFHFQYLIDELVPNSKKGSAFFMQDSLTGGAGYIYGITPDFQLSLAGDIVGNKPKDRASTISYDVTGGVNFKLVSGLWLSLGVGGASKTPNTTGSVFVLSNLKFSFFDNSTDVSDLRKSIGRAGVSSSP